MVGYKLDIHGQNLVTAFMMDLLHHQIQHSAQLCRRGMVTRLSLRDILVHIIMYVLWSD